MDLIDRQALLRKLFPYEVVDKRNCAINAYVVERAILDMPNKADNEEVNKAIDYLEHILEDWGAWRTHHEVLCKVIEIFVEAVKEE